VASSDYQTEERKLSNDEWFQLQLKLLSRDQTGVSVESRELFSKANEILSTQTGKTTDVSQPVTPILEPVVKPAAAQIPEKKPEPPRASQPARPQPPAATPGKPIPLDDLLSELNFTIANSEPEPEFNAEEYFGKTVPRREEQPIKPVTYATPSALSAAPAETVPYATAAYTSAQYEPPPYSSVPYTADPLKPLYEQSRQPAPPISAPPVPDYEEPNLIPVFQPPAAAPPAETAPSDLWQPPQRKPRAAAKPVPKTGGKQMKFAIALYCYWFVIGIVLLALVATTGAAFIFQMSHPNEETILGYKPVKIISDSMEPTIMTNALIIAKQVSFDDIEKNDIIIYERSNGEMITHRVVDFTGDIAVTQGDNLNYPDAAGVTAYNFKYKVVAILNWTADFGKMPQTLFICLIPVAVIAAFALIGFFLTKAAKKAEASEKAKREQRG